MTSLSRLSHALRTFGVVSFVSSAALSQAPPPATGTTTPAAPPATGAPDKRACAEAFETAQLLKSVGKLDEALTQAAICAAPSCPKTTTVPCGAWRTEWDALLAELTFEVTDEQGTLTQDATLVVDAKPPFSAVPKTLRLGPGPHALRFSRAGQPDQTAAVVLGERQRETVRVSFPRATPASVVPAPAAPTRPAAGPARVPLATWVFGGIGVAGVATFAGFALAGRADQRALEDTCAPRCSPSQASSAKTKYLVADIGLGVGVLSIVAASYFALRAPSAPATPTATSSSRPTFVVSPMASGIGPGAMLTGTF